MSAYETQILKKSPSMPVLMGRALLTSQKSKKSAVPPISLKLDGLKIDKGHLKRYAKVCGFDVSTCMEQLPLTYPHMLAFPMHMELMLHEDFPFAVMGLVHVKNSITQHQAIDVKQNLSINCFIEPLEDHAKGKVFSIITEVEQNGELCWRSSSSMLKRMSNPTANVSKTESSSEKSSASTEPKESWKLPENLGRSYGAVSGDRNPIHLFALSAKLFGFKNHIAHGMWTKARCAAALSDELSSYPCELDVEFKLPIFLPGKINFYCNEMTQDKDQKGTKKEVEVWNKDGSKPHLKGTVTSA